MRLHQPRRSFITGMIVGVYALAQFFFPVASHAADPKGVTAEVKFKDQYGQWQTWGKAANLAPGESKKIGSFPGPYFTVVGVAGGAKIMNDPFLNILLKVAGTNSWEFALKDRKYMALVY